jgi:alpha-mannosidase
MDHFMPSHLFLYALLGLAAAAAARPADAADANAPQKDGVCCAIGNHWSYIGIGWQLGIESCVLSCEDAMEAYDRAGIKICLNEDARAYEFMDEQFPEVTRRLRRYLAEGKVELIGGTYGQPMGTSVSGESNIRQIVLGRETIKKTLGYDLTTFLEEEEFTHPQLPQLLAGAGFKYASLSQLDTWGRAGIPPIELNVMNWQGKDGTTIPTTPKNSLFWCGTNRKELSQQPNFRRLQALGKPLLMTWEEFGWELPETPAYLTRPAVYKGLEGGYPVEYVTLTEYMDKYGRHPKETVYLDMDAWNKSLTWGLGGDQVRIYDRKVEATLLAAETFDAIASTLGARANLTALDAAWKDLLASQSHDVGLCEYSRWQDWAGNRMAPLDRVEDLHNFTWGSLGYNHLDAAQKRGKAVLDRALSHIARKIGSNAKRGNLAVTVFNPCNGERTEVISTGRIYPIPEGIRDIAIKNGSGRVVPSQIVKSEADKNGNLVMANVAFLATGVPSVGYDTYYISFKKAAAPRSDLVIDEADLTMENACIRVRLDPKTGAVASLFDKRAGREMLSSPFPVFKGRPNKGYPLYGDIPQEYDSANSQAQIEWTEKGAVRGTLKARHDWPHLAFETRVTLSAGAPYVEVVSRALSQVPPQPDANPPDIVEGYWLSFAGAFEPARVYRDYPLAVEPTKHPAFHALTFVDLTDKDGGLLYLHPGTQWFRLGEKGQISNLVMREWESHFTREYGWPRYAEYRHALMPHGKGFTNAGRERAATDFSRPMLCVIGKPHEGSLPSRKSFLTISPDNVQLSCFRKAMDGGFELRVVEVEGHDGEAQAIFNVPVKRADRTDLLGRKLSDLTVSGGVTKLDVAPWKVVTVRLR